MDAKYIFRVIKTSLLIAILFGVLANSCDDQEDIRFHLRECVKASTDIHFEIIFGEPGLDVYTMVDSIEQNLQSIGVVDIINKDSYLQLIESAKREDTMLTQNKIIKRYCIISDIIIVDVVSYCPYKVVVERENNLKSSIVGQLEMSQALLASGYELDQVAEYVNCISTNDFKHVEYRAPVLVMLLFKLGDKPPDAQK